MILIVKYEVYYNAFKITLALCCVRVCYVHVRGPALFSMLYVVQVWACLCSKILAKIITTRIAHYLSLRNCGSKLLTKPRCLHMSCTVEHVYWEPILLVMYLVCLFCARQWQTYRTPVKRGPRESYTEMYIESYGEFANVAHDAILRCCGVRLLVSLLCRKLKDGIVFSCNNANNKRKILSEGMW